MRWTDDERLGRQLSFVEAIDRLKEVQRRSYLCSGRRRENSAEHSWHVALLALVLAEYAERPVQVDRVVRMLLVHDVVEIDAGDTFLYDEVGSRDKAERERAAADRLFGLLPADQAEALRALWDEYECGDSAEGRFARAVDRLMPLLHNALTEGRSWQEHGIVRQQVEETNRGTFEAGSSKLWDLVRHVIEDSAERGYLPT